MLEKILLVDDEPAILQGYQRILHREFQIDTAASGAEALNKLETETYAVVVSDMRMPGTPHALVSMNSIGEPADPSHTACGRVFDHARRVRLTGCRTDCLRDDAFDDPLEIVEFGARMATIFRDTVEQTREDELHQSTDRGAREFCPNPRAEHRCRIAA